MDSSSEDAEAGIFGMKEYAYAFYFSTVTMVSVGFGDISPVNIYEVIICNIFMLIACGMFAHTINTIGVIAEGLGKKKR